MMETTGFSTWQGHIRKAGLGFSLHPIRLAFSFIMFLLTGITLLSFQLLQCFPIFGIWHRRHLPWKVSLNPLCQMWHPVACHASWNHFHIFPSVGTCLPHSSLSMEQQSQSQHKQCLWSVNLHWPPDQRLQRAKPANHVRIPYILKARVSRQTAPIIITGKLISCYNLSIAWIYYFIFVFSGIFQDREYYFPLCRKEAQRHLS